jgi:hypothetical protein
MRPIVGVLLVLGGMLSAEPLIRSAEPDPALRSRSLARQLTTALSAQGLDAIAAQDPDEPDRFVAALFFPGSQLLIISARYASPSVMHARLSSKQYRDVYLDLQQAAIANTSWFLQDMMADGLSADRDQTADVLYVGSATTVFDNDWHKHNLSQQQYAEQVSKADQRYARLLDALLAQLRRDQPPGVTTTAAAQH